MSRFHQKRPQPKTSVTSPIVMLPAMSAEAMASALDKFIKPMSAAEFYKETLSLRWVRLPGPKMREPHTNLSRSVLNTLILPCAANRFRPPVRSSSLAQPGQRKATRLVHLESLLNYVEQQAVKTVAAGVAKRKRRMKGKRA